VSGLTEFLEVPYGTCHYQTTLCDPLACPPNDVDISLCLKLVSAGNAMQARLMPLCGVRLSVGLFVCHIRCQMSNRILNFFHRRVSKPF